MYVQVVQFSIQLYNFYFVLLLLLSLGVMVARQILVLLVCVQIAEGQHDLSSEGAHLTTT